MKSIDGNTCYDSKLYEKLLTKGFGSLKGFFKKDYTEEAKLVMLLFSKQLMFQFIQQRSFPKTFKEQISFRYLLFTEIQSFLSESSTVKKITELNWVKKWLQKQSTLTTVDDPEQRLQEEVFASYSILPFPYQMTCQRQIQHRVQIQVWDRLFVRAEICLYEWLDADENSERTPTPLDEKFILQRLLYFHHPYYENEHLVTWLTVLEEWMGGEESRRPKVWALLGLFQKSLPTPFVMPNPDGNKIHWRLKKFVILSTVNSVESVLKVKLSTFSRYLLISILEDVQVRQDVVYFSQNTDVLKDYKKNEERASHRLIDKLQLFLTISGEGLSKTEKSCLFDLILLSVFSCQELEREKQAEFFLSGCLKNFPSSWIAVTRAVLLTMDNDKKENPSLLRFFFSLLSFPFQSTYTLEAECQDSIQAWDQRCADSEKVLYNVVAGKNEDLRFYQKFDLYKLLNFHEAFYENGKGVFWLQLIADWMHGRPQRRANLRSALELSLGQLFSIPKLPKPGGCVTEASFQSYVIYRTLHSIENGLGFEFPVFIVDIMTKAMQQVKARQDIAFFLSHPRILRKYQVEKRGADRIIKNFQIYYSYLEVLNELPNTARSDFLSQVFTLNPLPDIKQPENMDKLVKISGIKKILGQIQNDLGFLFSKFVYERLLQQMENSTVLYDFLLFVCHPEILWKFKMNQGSPSDFMIRNFKIFYAYFSKMEDFSEKDKRDLLDLIFLSNEEYDRCPITMRYLPYKLGSSLTSKSLTRAWQRLSQRIKTALEKHEESLLIHLLGFAIRNIHYLEQVRCENLYDLEIIRLFSQKPAVRLSHIMLYETQAGGSMQFEEKISKLGRLSLEQKKFLYALRNEENFQEYLEFLNRLQAITDHALDSAFVFHFLMSDFKTGKTIAGRNENCIEQIMDRLDLLDEFLKESKNLSKKEQIQDLFSELMNKLSKVAVEKDQMLICGALQSLMLKKFGLLENEIS